MKGVEAICDFTYAGWGFWVDSNLSYLCSRYVAMKAAPASVVQQEPEEPASGYTTTGAGTHFSPRSAVQRLVSHFQPTLLPSHQGGTSEGF